MTFTDDDLKRLKEWAQLNGPKTTGIGFDDEILALFARLEAAEMVLSKPHSCLPGMEDNCNGCKAKEAWCKVASK